MVKPGDIVRYLNDVGGGKVLRIEGNLAIVDDDGFETPMPVRECVVVGNAVHEFRASEPTTPKSIAPEPAQPPTSYTPTPEEIAETPEGDILNVVIGYEPIDIKELSKTDFDAYLVNDSNYYLYFTYMTRSDDTPYWTLRYAGIVEPNIQLHLGEIDRDEIALMDRVAVQYIAFKQNRDFPMKSPGAVEYKLDTTKFFKLHCFHDNIYFDTPVIALDIVKNDIPAQPFSVNHKKMEKEMRSKKRADERTTRRPVVKRTKTTRNGDKIEVDLHINELVDNTRGLSPADMLNMQIDEFRRVMDSNLKNHGQKIVFIHGKGEGVLRKAILKELNHRYKGHDVQDASFQEYGFGATQVTIK